MHEISTWGRVAEVAGGITIWAILSYFWLTTQALMTLTIFLWVDVLFWLLDSYIVTKDTSSKKLVEWIARKFWRRSLPFIFIAALRWVWYENIETMATMVMSILIISEAYSIIWHIYSINYKEKLPEIDALKMLIEKIWNLFKWQLESKKDGEGWEQLQ